MKLQYEVVPWDHMGFGALDPALPPVDTLDAVVGLLKGPADCILAINKDGSRRELTDEESRTLAEIQNRA
jgi:hypothetical protein